MISPEDNVEQEGMFGINTILEPYVAAYLIITLWCLSVFSFVKPGKESFRVKLWHLGSVLVVVTWDPEARYGWNCTDTLWLYECIIQSHCCSHMIHDICACKSSCYYSGRPLTAASRCAQASVLKIFFFISSVERELTQIVHLVWSNGDALILRSPIVFCDFWDYSINCASLVCDPCHSLIGMFYFLRCMYGYGYARDCLSTAQRHVNSLIFLESY